MLGGGDASVMSPKDAPKVSVLPQPSRTDSFRAAVLTGLHVESLHCWRRSSSRGAAGPRRRPRRDAQSPGGAVSCSSCELGPGLCSCAGLGWREGTWVLLLPRCSCFAGFKRVFLPPVRTGQSRAALGPVRLWGCCPSAPAGPPPAPRGPGDPPFPLCQPQITPSTSCKVAF